MPMTTEERIAARPQARRKILQEVFILKMTEALSGAMEDQGVTMEELAQRMRTNKREIRRILDGRLTSLRNFANAFDALNVDITVSTRREA